MIRTKSCLLSYHHHPGVSHHPQPAHDAVTRLCKAPAAWTVTSRDGPTTRRSGRAGARHLPGHPRHCHRALHRYRIHRHHDRRHRRHRRHRRGCGVAVPTVNAVVRTKRAILPAILEPEGRGGGEGGLGGSRRGRRCRGRIARAWSWAARSSTSAVSSGTVQSRSHAMGQERSGRHPALIPRQSGHWRISERRRGSGIASISASMSVSSQ